MEQTTATAVADDNVTGSPDTLYLLDVDNTANGSAVFVKFWDNAAPVVGTTAADYVYKVPASVRRQWVITQGVAFAVAISFACVTGAAEANTTSPGNPVIVRLATS